MTWKQALLKSIEKWDRICFGHGSKFDECALCTKDKTFDSKYGEHKCHFCPILKVTGEQECYGTPYHEWGNDKDDAIHEYLFLCMLYHEYYGDA
jgi:hypothetical protein